MKNVFSKYPLLFIALFLVAVVLVILAIILINRGSSPTRTGGKPTPIPSGSAGFPTILPEADPPAIAELPRNDRAIDTTADPVKASQAEVAKLRPKLPYFSDFTATTRQQISIVIPNTKYQDNVWKLTVNVFGVNFQVPKSDPTYEKEKASFLEAANDIFSWAEKNEADPNLIIIKWGDRAYIQDRAEQWLKE